MMLTQRIPHTSDLLSELNMSEYSEVKRRIFPYSASSYLTISISYRDKFLKTTKVKQCYII